MAVRSTMANLIDTLRGLTNAGTSDYTVGSDTFWSSRQLQAILDRYSTQVKDEPVYPKQTLEAGGVISYYDYESRYKWFEQTDGGTLKFVIRDSTGAISATTGWTADYESGRVKFSADQAGATYYFTGTSFDIYAAAADVWYQKAAHAADFIDFSTDGHNIKRSHQVEAALRMAQRYENMADHPVGASSASAETVRSDLR